MAVFKVVALLAFLLLTIFGVAFYGHFYSSVDDSNDYNGNDNGSFLGEELWSKANLDRCDKPPNNVTVYSKPGLKCYQYRADLRLYRLEVLNYEPILVVFRNFIDRNEAEGYLREASRYKSNQAKVVDGGVRTVQKKTRVANVSFVYFNQEASNPTITRILKSARRAIPIVDFDASENWQVMSYSKGGHYIPHNDMLDYPKEEEEVEYWMEKYGNRIFTFFLILKTADVGGGTVFPNLKLTVIPNAGDVVFWRSMDEKKNQHRSALHGACPLRSGFKTAATIWIREMNQKVFDGLFKTGRFDDDLVVQPKANHISRAI